MGRNQKGRGMGKMLRWRAKWRGRGGWGAFMEAGVGYIMIGME
jgi:hypothetical protein